MKIRLVKLIILILLCTGCRTDDGGDDDGGPDDSDDQMEDWRIKPLEEVNTEVAFARGHQSQDAKGGAASKPAEGAWPRAIINPPAVSVRVSIRTCTPAAADPTSYVRIHA